MQLTARIAYVALIKFHNLYDCCLRFLISHTTMLAAALMNHLASDMTVRQRRWSPHIDPIYRVTGLAVNHKIRMLELLLIVTSIQ